MANQVLMFNKQQKTILLKSMIIISSKVHSPSLILASEKKAHDLSNLAEFISNYQNGSNSFALTFGELCDLTAAESRFTDEDQFTNISFELLD